MGQAVEHTDQGVAANPQLLAEGHEIGKCHDHGETEQKLHRQQPRHVRRKFAQGLGLLAVQGMPGRVIGQRQYQHEGQQRQPGQPAVQVYAQALRGQQPQQDRAADHRQACRILRPVQGPGQIPALELGRQVGIGRRHRPAESALDDQRQHKHPQIGTEARQQKTREQPCMGTQQRNTATVAIGPAPPEWCGQGCAQRRQDKQHADGPARGIRGQVGEDPWQVQGNAQGSKGRQVMPQQYAGNQTALHATSSSRKFAAL